MTAFIPTDIRREYANTHSQEAADKVPFRCFTAAAEYMNINGYSAEDLYMRPLSEEQQFMHTIVMHVVQVLKLVEEGKFEKNGFYLR